MRVIALLLLILSPPLWAGDDDDEELDALELAPAAPALAPARMRLELDFADLSVDAAPGMGAQTGGARDTRAFRAQLLAGGSPGPELFPAEGLLSEHDLPARRTGPCAQRLCLLTEAAPAALLGQPEAQALAQLGFDTDLPPDAGRPPLNLVVVWDGSGTPALPPLAVALTALLGERAQPGDQLRLVLPGEGGPRVVAPDPGDAAGEVSAALGRPAHRGGQPALVERALQEAQALQAGSGALGRVLWLYGGPSAPRLSDQPRLQAAAERAALAGVGLSAVGLGADADPSGLAWIGELPGGVATSVPSTEALVDTVAQDLESLLWPLAYDLALELTPAPGWRLSGVYGIPGAALQWDSTGAARLSVRTLFASRKRGAIFFAFAPEGVSELPAVPLRLGSTLATARLAWRDAAQGAWRQHEAAFVLEPATERSLGWHRGLLLVQELLAVHAGARALQSGVGFAAARAQLRELPRLP